ncbi:MAG: MFS transporter [Nanoarchaeota archaeon]
MGILIRKYHGARAFTGMAKLSFVIFFSSLAASLTDTIWAVYLKGFLHSDALVGFYSGFLSVLAFISFFVLVPLIEKSKKSSIYSVALFLIGVLILVLSINKNLIIFIILSIAITILITIKITAFGIIVRDKSNKEKVSEDEGVIYSFNNTAWVIGPLIAGLVLIDFGMPIVFVSSSLLIFISFILFKISNIKDSNIMKKAYGNVFSNLADYFNNKDRVISYILGSGVTFWWVLIYLYTPLLMIENGLPTSSIGIFLFAAAAPLIVLEYPFSKIAGKFGAKKLFALGYFIALIASSMAFVFIEQIYVALGFLVFGSVGLAMLEPTTEAYFFDLLKNKKDENKFYGPYNTAIETGLIVGKLAPAALLLILPFKFIYILFAIILLGLFLLSFKAVNIIEGKKK